ncbi:MAG TPA: TetR family transcriptional regulator [Acidimicrobiales bacterium]|nr:TetR family transcriptional regulator [Acidimicrobiales bacterium]
MSQIVPEGLRQRKRRATGRRIASEAARLVLDQGMAATTVEQIAAAAGVGRASFFRYFATKERAVAEGFTGVWLRMIVDALERQPAGLPALDAVRAGFAELAEDFGGIRELTMSQATLSRSSAALSAWTLQVYLSYEDAVAASVADRFEELDAGDPRPRLVGALVMAAVRLALDDWVASGGSVDLPAMIDRNLRSVAIIRAPSPALAGAARERP